MRRIARSAISKFGMSSGRNATIGPTLIVPAAMPRSGTVPAVLDHRVERVGRKSIPANTDERLGPPVQERRHGSVQVLHIAAARLCRQARPCARRRFAAETAASHRDLVGAEPI
jgi:hypothetical protein